MTELMLTDRRTVEVEAYTAHIDGRSVELWVSEGRLLAYLLAHAGEVCWKHQIRRETGIRSDNGLRTAAVTLRRKLGAVPGIEILPVRGVGYRLERT